MTQSASFVDSGEEKIAREVMGATAGKGDGTTDNTSSNPNLLLSLLLPFVSGQMQPPTNPVQIAQTTAQEGQASSQSLQDIVSPSVLTRSRSTQGAMTEAVGADLGRGQTAVNGAPPSLGREGQGQAVRASFISLSDEQRSPVFAAQSVSTANAESTSVITRNAEPTKVSMPDAKPRAIFSQPAVDTTLKDRPVERGVDEQNSTRSAKLAGQTSFIPAAPKNGDQAGERSESQPLGALEKGGAQAVEIKGGDTLGQPTPPRTAMRPIFPAAPTGASTPDETKVGIKEGDTLGQPTPPRAAMRPIFPTPPTGASTPDETKVEIKEGDTLGQPTPPRAAMRPIFPTPPTGASTSDETKATTLSKGVLNPYDSEERKESITYSGQTPVGLQEPRTEMLDYSAQIPTPGLELGASLGRTPQARLFRQGQISEVPAGERNQVTETDIRRTTLPPLPFPEQEPQTFSAALKEPVHVEVRTMGTIAPAASNGQTKGKEKPETVPRSARFLTSEPLTSPTPRQGDSSAASVESLTVTAPTERANPSGEAGKPLMAPRLALFPTQKSQDVPVTSQETAPVSAKPAGTAAELVPSESNSTASPAAERFLVEGLVRGKGSSSFPNIQKSVVEADSLTPKSTGIPSLSVSQLQPERPLGPRNNLEAWQPVVSQVAERIVANVREESRGARLQLAPPELGKVDIQLVVEGSHIRAHIVAGSADVGALIQTHLPELKHALQEHRLDLDTVRVDVQSDSGGRDASSRNFQQDRRAGGRGSNLGSSATAVEEKESLPVLSPVQARGRVSVWA